jgi:predicted DCC family thiol-disulfide oxidoreductase YuxK
MPDSIEDTAAGPWGAARVLVLFDGRCGICTRCMQWVQARDTSGRLRFQPNQAPGLADRLGLRREDVDRELYAITRSGRTYRGAGAFYRVFRELGGPWARFARCYELAGVRWCADRGYAWFARHRGRFARWGVTPACERPCAPCEAEPASDPSRAGAVQPPH